MAYHLLQRDGVCVWGRKDWCSDPIAHPPLWSWVTNHLRCINHLFLLVSRRKISLMLLRHPLPTTQPPASKSILLLRVCLLIIIKIVSYTSASLVRILNCRWLGGMLFHSSLSFLYFQGKKKPTRPTPTLPPRPQISCIVNIDRGEKGDIHNRSFNRQPSCIMFNSMASPLLHLI